MKIQTSKKRVESKTKIVVNKCFDGDIISLEKAPAETFAKKILGEGIAIQPNKVELYAPPLWNE